MACFVDYEFSNSRELLASPRHRLADRLKNSDIQLLICWKNRTDQIRHIRGSA